LKYLCLAILVLLLPFPATYQIKPQIAPVAKADSQPAESPTPTIQTPPSDFWGLETTLILPTDKTELQQLVETSEYPQIFTKLIGCESQWQNIARMDSNHQFSYGILQFQKGTWEQFAPLAGISSTPMNPAAAIQVASYMISEGQLHRWSCAHITGLL
jgi:hypothetical protein